MLSGGQPAALAAPAPCPEPSLPGVSVVLTGRGASTFLCPAPLQRTVRVGEERAACSESRVHAARPSELHPDVVDTVLKVSV